MIYTINDKEELQRNQQRETLEFLECKQNSHRIGTKEIVRERKRETAYSDDLEEFLLVGRHGGPHRLRGSGIMRDEATENGDYGSFAGRRRNQMRRERERERERKKEILTSSSCFGGIRTHDLHLRRGV